MVINKFIEASKAQIKNLNTIVFKQLQTEDYQLHKIQNNVKEAFKSVTELLNQSVSILVKQDTSPFILISTTDSALVFPAIVFQGTASYDTKLNAYITPQAGLFMCHIHMVITITAGAPTFLAVKLKSSINKVVATAYSAIVATRATLNFMFVYNAENNENLSFEIASDVGGVTGTMSNDSKICFYLMG